MKRAFATVGVMLSLLLLVVPASASSIKEELTRTLFGGQNPSFLTFSTADGKIHPFLSADPDPKRFGTPILAIGSVGSVVANAMSNEILSESAVIPVPSGSAAFAYEFNPDLNIFERRSIGLGTIFNERANTLGRGAFAIGAAYIRQDFDAFNGEDISHLRIRSGLFARRPFLGELVKNGDVEAILDLDVTTNSVALWATYGVTEWLDVSLLLPITVIDLRARSTIRNVTGQLSEDLPAFLPNSQCTIQNPAHCRIADFTILRRGTPLTITNPHTGDILGKGQAFSDTVDETRGGVGDMILRGKARFFRGDWGIFGGLTEFTFPTGDRDNFLGDDAFKARFLLLYSTSLFAGRVNFHLNGGGRVTTQTSRKNTLEYGSAVDVRITEQLSLVAELIGSWRVDPRVDSKGVLPNNFIDGAFGFKANLFRGLILSASFRIPATDDGLRSDLVYLAGLEYDF